AVILVAGAVLIFTNLTDRPLWQDEAGTALLSQTVLKFGVPKGFDGVNYLSQVRGIEYGRNMMWRWHGWLTFYIEAVSLKIFGGNTFAARLPSALFGVLNIFLVYLLTLRLFNDRKTALIAALICALCVPHILLARQARYLTLEILLALTAFCAYTGVDGLKGRRAAVYAVSMFMLFHVIHVVFAAAVAAICVHAVIFDRGKMKKTFLLSGIVTAVNLPFLLTIYKIGITEAQPGLKNPFTVLSVLKGYAVTFYENMAVPLALLGAGAGLAVWFLYGRRAKGVAGPRTADVMLPVLIVLFNFAVMPLASGLNDFRQIVLAVPASIVLPALCIGLAFNSAAWAGVLCIIIAVSGRSMHSYIYEITHKFNSGIRASCRYLQENAQKGDIVATSYGDLPLKFYTGLKVIYPYWGEDMSAVRNAKWVIYRGYNISPALCQ
ncbi:MAG: glycosyltransferase family 39 protein, partial [Spirochaetia bacterium]|nr:glycosyltransferase family 39 protein [Spirochaetia bacterium]